MSGIEKKRRLTVRRSQTADHQEGAELNKEWVLNAIATEAAKMAERSKVENDNLKRRLEVTEVTLAAAIQMIATIQEGIALTSAEVDITPVKTLLEELSGKIAIGEQEADILNGYQRSLAEAQPNKKEPLDPLLAASIEAQRRLKGAGELEQSIAVMAAELQNSDPDSLYFDDLTMTNMIDDSET